MNAVTRFHVLFTRNEISETVNRLAAEINRDYAGKEVLLVGVLKGSFVFLADLIRLLDLPVEVDFIGLSSYGSGTKSSGKVRVGRGLRTQVRGRNVLVVEDIVDTGLTTGYLLDYLRKKKPASLKLCSLTESPPGARPRLPLIISVLPFPISLWWATAWIGTRSSVISLTCVLSRRKIDVSPVSPVNLGG